MTAANSPAFVFICRHSAWSSQAAACLEILLTAGVFEQDAVLVLQDDGVLQLLSGQDGAGLGLKTLADQLPALELYGITRVYVESAALGARGISLDDATLEVIPLQAAQLSAMIAVSRHVLVF